MKPKENTFAENVKTPADDALTTEQIAAFTGMYRNTAKGNVVRVSAGDGKLQLEFYGSNFGLRPVAPNEFLLLDFPVDAKLTFALQAGHASEMKISGDEMVEATYQSVKESTPTADELAAYSGDFTSDELGVLYHLRVFEGKLKLTGISDTHGIPRTGIPMPNTLRPTVTDEFEISDQANTFHFVKDAKEGITGFTLSAGGTHGIEFLRTVEVKNSPPR